MSKIKSTTYHILRRYVIESTVLPLANVNITVYNICSKSSEWPKTVMLNSKLCIKRNGIFFNITLLMISSYV